MTTMKASKHEILKSQWQNLVKEQKESGLSIRKWCEENNISQNKFYYWKRIIWEDTLIKAGTLAVTGQTQFVEVSQNITDTKDDNKYTCAILRSNGIEIEILNGADPNTLALVLNLVESGYSGMPLAEQEKMPGNS